MESPDNMVVNCQGSARRLSLVLSEESLWDVINISFGVFAPLAGFMDHDTYATTLETCCLPDGSPWSIPITLPVIEGLARKLARQSEVDLVDKDGVLCARLEIADIFQVDFERDIPRIFGTFDPSHPGVAMEMSRDSFRVGGRIVASDLVSLRKRTSEFFMSPEEVRRTIEERSLETVVGFQTRNPPHRAHEYLQRKALHFADGLFIQPLIGWKKAGDFTPRAIVEGYNVLLEKFFPEKRVVFSTLCTAMRYAGPREAIFHALIRKNFGCTHFIVGRDHAGVGEFYGVYEAQERCLAISGLGIEILPWKEPYYCLSCDMMVTADVCRHYMDREQVVSVSGTKIREHLTHQTLPSGTMMRPEIARVLLALEQEGSAFCE